MPNPEKIIDVNLDKMRSRPDVRAARSEMLSAKAGLELAEANLWPKLSLRSFFGVQEISNGMIEAGNPIWSLAADISAPVLNFGVLRGAKNAADANSQAAIFVYEKAVLTALQEASTSLSDFLNSVNALEDQEKTIQHRGETIDLARKRYESGLTDMSDLVAAQSDLKRTNLERIDIKLKALQAYIRLQKSLGLGVGKKI